MFPPDIWWLKATLLSSVVLRYTGPVGKMRCLNHFQTGFGRDRENILKIGIKKTCNIPDNWSCK
jgi:hypothetical protein